MDKSIPIVLVGASLFLSAVFTTTGGTVSLGDYLGDDEPPAPAPPKRVSARAAPAVPRAEVAPANPDRPTPPAMPRGARPAPEARNPLPVAQTRIPRIEANQRLFLARKFWGTHVLASQSAESMKNLARRGPAANQANQIMSRMSELASEALTYARQYDPEFVTAKGR